MRLWRSRTIAVATLGVVVVGGLTSCRPVGQTGIDETLAKSTPTHSGPWTEPDLRAATGAWGSYVVDVKAAPDGSGGQVLFELGGHAKGEWHSTGASKKRVRGTGKSKNHYTTGDDGSAVYLDWNTNCIQATVVGNTAKTRQFEVVSAIRKMNCSEYSHCPEVRFAVFQCGPNEIATLDANKPTAP
jgi:hypothetical protein